MTDIFFVLLFVFVELGEDSIVFSNNQKQMIQQKIVFFTITLLTVKSQVLSHV